MSEGGYVVLESIYVKHDHGSSRTIAIGKGKLSYSTTGGNCFFDDEIDFLRKCADKIRKERGWV